MISRNKLKYFTSLHQKKYRKQYGSFLAEGEKIVRELLTSPLTFLEPVTLLAGPAFIDSLPAVPQDIEIITVDQSELKRISSLNTPALAILEIKIPEYGYDPLEITQRNVIFLDDIRDPGNLGTIIRTCDWFGIYDIFCSRESVDTYNPKVVQASMGSVARVRVHYVDPAELITGLKEVQPAFQISGTVMDGENIYSRPLPSPGIIMFGNESRGLSGDIISSCDNLLTIPSSGAPWAESLNVGIAAAIVCAEWHRRDIIQNENTGKRYRN